MAAVALTEEQLQNSLATSEEDAEFEEDDELAAGVLAENAAAFAANNQLQNRLLAEQGEESSIDEEGEDEEDLSEEDTGSEDRDIDMPDSPENNEEEDSSGEEDEDQSSDEDEEGVGAVKIQPRRLKEDEDVVTESDGDSESAPSINNDDDDASKDSSDGDVEPEWEVNGEEEDELVNPNRCIFCQQDEEHDPSEDFETYLACGVCGDNAHRQCARDADALIAEDDSDAWYCPGCVANKLVPEKAIQEVEEEQLDANARRISRDRIAGNLLPSQRAIKPDSHSVFAQLIDPDDPLDGSRLLRKRKTSADADHAIEELSSPRRRARDRETTTEMKSNGISLKTEPILASSEAPLESSSSRASRSLRPKVPTPIPKASIVSATKKSIKVVFRLDSSELARITSMAPNPKKKKKSSRPVIPARTDLANSSFLPSAYSQPFYSLHDREVDELKSKPYGGILSEQDADTSMTLPRPEHRKQFDEARQKAEEEWKARVAAAAEAAAMSGIKKPRKVSGPASQIEYIEFGEYQIDIWYAAPYPEEYSRNKALFICEFCLKYMESDIVAWRHKTKCPWKHPPGDEIYRDGKVMIFEVDGRKNPLYCQNLCLLAKLFLGSKTLYYDVEPFLFYVMTEYDELGCHFVGYFSKEKRPSSQNNVSCILVLPIHQRKGYGHLLIDFSYLLTRVEKKTGSPEKPLSDMGLVSYRNYWRLVLCYYLRDFRSGDRIPSVKEISDDMGLTPDDVISALDALGALIRDPQSGVYAFRLQTEYYNEVIRQHESKGYASLNAKALVWTPYIMGRGNTAAFEHAPPLNTVAPRDEEEEENMAEEEEAFSAGKHVSQNPNGITNGATEAVTESLGKLSTDAGDSITVAQSDISSSSARSNDSTSKTSYYEAAASIPATQFEIFPPLPGSKARGTPRPSVSRPKSSRPTPRRSSTGNSARRTTPRTSSRRKSGGTGRGPGRWPRGTKKTDFGNAESGPGLPPTLLKTRSRLGNEVVLGVEEEEMDDYIDDNEEAVHDDYEEEEDDEDDLEDDVEDEDPDAILYETPAMKKRRNGDSRKAQGLGKPLPLGKGKPGMGKGKTILPPVPSREDEIMADLTDDDAEGEDE